MEPFYFGTPPAIRFGVYHPAAGGPPAKAVLLCPAVGHEYVRAHRALRNLAVQLSRAGMAVLRFDYVGVGDSSGDAEDGTVERWVADIHAAADELRRRSGLSRMTLIGLRLGAALAAVAAAGRRDVDRLVAWDPVLEGSQYLHELAALQRAWLADRLVAGAADLESRELLGMPVTPDLRRGLASLVLPPAGPGKAPVDIVVSGPRPDCAAWVESAANQGGCATSHQVDSAGGWTNPEAVHQLLLPHEVLRHIAALLAAP